MKIILRGKVIKKVKNENNFSIFTIFYFNFLFLLFDFFFYLNKKKLLLVQKLRLP